MERHTDERQLLQALGLSVLATSDGVVTFANAAAADLFQTIAADLVGRRVGELVEINEAAEQAMIDVLGGGTWRGDLTLRRRGGAPLLATTTVTPIRDDGGIVVGAIVALEDMTETRRVEAEAEESAQRLRLAHSAAELGAWHWNAVDDTNVWDDQLHRIYGLEPGTFDGTWDAWVASIHPDDRLTSIAVAQQAMADLSTYVLRHRIVHPDGRPRWIEAHGKVLIGPDGGAAGTIGCVQDVTERVLMQQRQSDAAARALVLQQLTTDFSEALTPEQVDAVHEAGLERVRAIVGSERPLSSEDEQLLDTLASQHAIAVARAELFSRTTAISEELQRSLAASPLPLLDRFELAVAYSPGGDDLEQVGGDWYDAVGTWGGGLALVVGDVMGRGVRAATTMIHVRAGIRGLLTIEADPASLLEAADQLLARDAPEQFVTAVAALIDPATGTMDLCNAGHIPLLLLRPDGSTQLIELASGAPLGVVPRLHRQTEQVLLEPGCTVIMVTDGVVESRDHDIDEGIELLRRRAGQLAGRSLEELVAGLAELADQRLQDDVTVVAARLR